MSIWEKEKYKRIEVFSRKNHQKYNGEQYFDSSHFMVTTFRMTWSMMMRCTPDMHGSDSWRPNILSTVETAIMWPNTCVLTGTKPLSLELRTQQTYFPPKNWKMTLSRLSLSLSSQQPLPSNICDAGISCWSKYSFSSTIFKNSQKITNLLSFTPYWRRFSDWERQEKGGVGSPLKWKVTWNHFQQRFFISTA